MEDNTIAIVDYESDDRLSNRVKYINYIARVIERYFPEKGIADIRMIVVYTGDVSKAESTLEISSLTLRIDQVFLSMLDGEAIYQSIREKIERKESLTEEEQMRLIILPLIDKGDEKKQQRIQQAVDLAKMLEDEKQQLYLISGILVVSDKFIDRQYAENLKRWMSMSKVFQLFEEEKQEAVIEAVKLNTQEIAEKLLSEGADTVLIMKSTGLTRKQIEEIQKRLLVVN